MFEHDHLERCDRCFEDISMGREKLCPYCEETLHQFCFEQHIEQECEYYDNAYAAAHATADAYAAADAAAAYAATPNHTEQECEYYDNAYQNHTKDDPTS